MRPIVAVRAALAAIAVVCVSVLFGTPTFAQETATVTLFHGIPGTPVDVVVDGDVVIPNFQPNTVASLSDFAGQTLTKLEVRPVGSTTPVIGPVDFAVPASGNSTVMAHLDEKGAPTVTTFTNDITPTAPDTGRLIVAHTAEAPGVDLVVGTERPIVNLTNGNAKALELPAGTISGAKLAVTGEAPTINVPDVKLAAGTDLIVYAVGSAVDGTLTFYTQTIDVGTTSTATTAPSTDPATTVATTTTMPPTTTSPEPVTTTVPPSVAPPTSAVPVTTPPPAGTATVTLLHGIPDVPVDVLVGGKVVFANFKAGETKNLSSFSGQTLSQLEVRGAGTTTTAIGPVNFEVPASGNWTVVAHLDAKGAPVLSAFENDTAKTAAGSGRVVVTHAAAAPAVDLVVGTARPIVNLTNGKAQALELPAGSISGAKLAPTGKDPIVDVPPVTLKAGTDLIVYAVGSIADGTFTFYTQTVTVGEMSDTNTTTTLVPPTTLAPITVVPKTGSGSTIWVAGLLLSITGLVLTMLARRGAPAK